MSRNLNTDHVKIAGAAVIWGSSGAFVKYLGLSPGVIAFFRVGIPVMVLGIWFTIKRERLFRNGVKIILMASVVNAVRLFFYFIGYLNAPIGNAIIILYAWPVFAVIFSHFFLREPLPCLNQILLFMAMGSIIMVFSDKNIRLDNSVVLGMGPCLSLLL
jgi:drug/metabolite transporter (DMT)-like permease